MNYVSKSRKHLYDTKINFSPNGTSSSTKSGINDKTCSNVHRGNI